jgi:tetratricopeptide (TPR) repeat protein
VALTTAALIGAALLLGTAVSAWQAVRASVERDRALDAEKRAEAEKANAQGALRFLLADVLEQADPYREPDRDLTVRTLLDRATDRLDRNTAMPPLVEAAIRQTLGKIYRGLGELKEGEPQLDRAYKLQRQHAGDDAPDTLDAGFELATLYWLQIDFAKAEPLFIQVLEGRRRLYGHDRGKTLEAVYGLAMLYLSRDELDRAEPLFVQALETGLRAYGDRNPDTLKFMHGLGITYYLQGRYDKAEPLLVNALKGRQVVLPDKHPSTQATRSTLALVYLGMNRLPEAEREARQSYEDRLEVFGKTHVDTPTSQATLARVYLAQGRRDEADRLLRDLRETAPRQRERLRVPHIWSIGKVGDALLLKQDFVEAESFLRLYLDLAEKKLPDGWRHAAAVSALGACLLGQKNYAKAEPLLLQGYKGLRQHEDRIPANFRRDRLTEAVKRVVQLYEETGKPDEAAKWRKELEAARLAPKGATQ